MPQLRQKQITKVTLPSFEDSTDPAIVELETPAMMGDFEQLELEGNESQARQSAMVIALKIKSWNLTDENNEPLPVTPDNILKLDAIDFATLTITLGLDKIMTRLSAAKKKTS